MLKLGSAIVNRALCRHMGATSISSELVIAHPAAILDTKDKDKPKEAPKAEPEIQMNGELLLNHAILQSQRKPLEVPTVVSGEEFFTMDMQKVCCPHEISEHIARVFYANRCQIEKAIKSSLDAQGNWSMVPAEERLAIWRKAASIIESDLMELKVHLILSLGKTESDASNDVCRLLNSLRSNSDYLEHLSQLRFDITGEVNVFPSFYLRPLDGFVAAMSSFESVALSAGLALSPVLMGNTVLWNPALEVASASYLVYKAFRKAGLPKGVLNFVPSNDRLFVDTITDSIHFAGVNYHGTAEGYRHIHKLVGDKMKRYICFPRLAAECQGTNFHFVHSSAKLDAVCSATMDAAFNFAGQYSTSLSRLFVPSSLWPELKERLCHAIAELKVGNPTAKDTKMGPVVNHLAFERLEKLINRTKLTHTLEILCGGNCDRSVGNFITPILAVAQDPLDPLLSEPIGGPILPVFVYADDALTDALQLLAHQSKYALSGSIFASRDEIISHCLKHLRMSASNLYINERCTGHPDGIPPFGGNRLSGTNDKSGSAYFLMRWSSPMLVEETLDTPMAVPLSIEKRT
ncbi:delta-1-pyrroline-5-carboxylate dehydrogenase, mitochondrial [Drosophila willistoni]|nr:delta-1-pyrroline-5-carboxylate dehydrogenase, mitochondrial [Drosophila willistoni]